MVNSPNSAIYECRVMHHRLEPKVHRFDYRVFYLWLDLDELDVLDRSLWWFGRNRWNLFSFYDDDHFARSGADVKSRLFHWLESQGFATSPIASVRLLTFPRVLGYIFNPVCFFYCLDAAGEPLCVVAEVTNTFHEKKPYLIAERDETGAFQRIVPKHFYVSPFSDLDLCFDFMLRMPGDKLEIRIDDRRDGRRVLLTTLTGRRRTLTGGALLLCAVKYPLLTLRVIFLIHWHALCLWLKGLKVHRKAEKPELQSGLHRPHESIASKTPPESQ